MATRQLVTFGLQRGGETDVLRGPAWDARLDGVTREALDMFQRGRRVCGGFLVIMQTSGWEFMTGVDEIKNSVIVGVIVPRSTVIPPIEATDRTP